MRALLETHRPGALTRSGSERRLLAAIRRRGLPEPLVNAVLDLEAHISRPDLMWPDHLLIVEYDGFEIHGTRAAMTRDRRTDRLRTANGWRTLRYTQSDNLDDVVSEIAAALRRPPLTGRPPASGG